MKKISILACKMIRSQNLCPADAKCLVALHRRMENLNVTKIKMFQFSVLWIAEGCEGNKTRAVCSLVLFKTQLAALKENIDALHIGHVYEFCPRKMTLFQQ
jgi:hypothetical protein